MLESLASQHGIEPVINLRGADCSACGSSTVESGTSLTSVYVEEKKGYWDKDAIGDPVWKTRWVTKSKLVDFSYCLCLDCGWFVTEPLGSSRLVIVGSAGYAIQDGSA